MTLQNELDRLFNVQYRLAASLVRDRSQSIAAARKNISEGRGHACETEDRQNLYLTTQQIANPAGRMEALVGEYNAIRDIETLVRGLKVSRAVGRFEHDAGGGTGFHVGKDIILTNHHVLPAEMFAEDYIFFKR